MMTIPVSPRAGQLPTLPVRVGVVEPRKHNLRPAQRPAARGRELQKLACLETSTVISSRQMESAAGERASKQMS